MPRAGVILKLDVDGITRNVLLGGHSLGCGQSSRLTGKWLREDIVALVRPAAIVGDKPCSGFLPRLCSAAIFGESEL
jgi:hypothetical protein